MVRQLIQRDTYIHRRDESPLFDDGNYFTFHNTLDSANTLSSGQLQNTKGNVSMTPFGKRSSENWQLYYQQGRYFIRNYDYLGTWQLGLTSDSKVVPKMLARDGSLGQQWTLSRQDDGTVRFINGLLGNESALGLGAGDTVPAMQAAGKGTGWTVLPNLSALGTGAKDPSMLKDNTDFEIEEVISSTIAPSATSSSSLASSPTAFTTGTKTGSVAAATSSPTNGVAGFATTSKSSSLGPGPIAGIAIGIVLIFALAGLLGYFLWSRRKANAPKDSAELSSSHSQEQKSYYAHHAAVGQQYEPQQHSQYAHYATPDTPAPRYEMGPGDAVVNQSQSQPQDLKHAHTAEPQVSHRAELG